MSSINTNTSAMAALQTLRHISSADGKRLWIRHQRYICSCIRSVEVHERLRGIADQSRWKTSTFASQSTMVCIDNTPHASRRSAPGGFFFARIQGCPSLLGTLVERAIFLSSGDPMVFRTINLRSIGRKRSLIGLAPRFKPSRRQLA